MDSGWPVQPLWPDEENPPAPAFTSATLDEIMGLVKPDPLKMAVPDPEGEIEMYAQRFRGFLCLPAWKMLWTQSSLGLRCWLADVRPISGSYLPAGGGIFWSCA